jgi:5-methylcytosine-specific restriction endonuclease McrA
MMSNYHLTGEYTIPQRCLKCGSEGLQLRIFVLENNPQIVSQVRIICPECEYSYSPTKDKNLDRRDGNPVCKWAREVKTRDNHKCQECGTTEDLEAHHIKSWADYPDLRLDVSNGITLCHACHVKLHGYDYRKETKK